MSSIFLKLWKLLHLSKDTQISIMKLFQDKFLFGVTGVIFDAKDQILLFKHTYRQNPWGLPGGYIHAHEHPVAALEREIEEESGLIVAIGERMKIKLDEEASRLDICYLGSFIGGDFKKSAEVEDFGLFPLNSLPLIPKNQLIIISEGLKLHQLHRKSFAASSHEKFLSEQGFFYRLQSALKN